MLTGSCDIIKAGLAGGSTSIGPIAPPMQQTPIQLLITQRILLNSQSVYNSTIDQPAYTANLSLDLSQITNGIDPGMLQNAEMINGTIIISNSVNSNLYNIIVNNLQNYQLNAQLTPQVLTTSGPAAAVTYQ
jgi:hypothetical protein